MLEEGGLHTYDLPETEMAQVFALKREYGHLSANDCFALATAGVHDDAILLTGDGLLRKVATARDVRVHGVLWIIDKLRAAGACGIGPLISASETWRSGDTVFLPRAEIEGRLGKLRRRCRG